jgi:hypothetical protein
MVGTAFDYLLRFLIKRQHPSAVTREWVAEDSLYALGCVQSKVKMKDGEVYIEERIDTRRNPAGRKCMEILAEARGLYEQFLRSGKVTTDLIEAAIRLAQLDNIYRSGYVDPNMGEVHPEDVKDLRRLIRIVDPRLFAVKEYCVLNPTFDEGSSLVGGADADILIDGMLIEVKTTKELKLKREHLNQLIGYLLLSRISRVDGLPRRYRGRKIRALGIYYSRFGLLYAIPVTDVIDRKRLPALIKWFVREAKRRWR